MDGCQNARNSETLLFCGSCGVRARDCAPNDHIACDACFGAWLQCKFSLVRFGAKDNAVFSALDLALPTLPPLPPCISVHSPQTALQVRRVLHANSHAKPSLPPEPHSLQMPLLSDLQRCKCGSLYSLSHPILPWFSNTMRMLCCSRSKQGSPF